MISKLMVIGWRCSVSRRALALTMPRVVTDAALDLEYFAFTGKQRNAY